MFSGCAGGAKFATGHLSQTLPKTTLVICLLLVALFWEPLLGFGARTRRDSTSRGRTAESIHKTRCHPYPLKILWLDNESSTALLDSRQKVALFLEKARDAGFNVVVPDVKNYMGFGFYRSSILPRASSVGGAPYPKDFDFLAAVVEEALARGLHVHAGINLFSEGGKGLLPSQRVGPIYEHPEWQTVLYDRWAQLSFSTGLTTRTLAVNSRGSSGISVYTPRTGEQLTSAVLLPRLPASVCVVTQGRVTSVLADDQVSTHGIAIPTDGYVVLAEDPLAGALLCAVPLSTTATLESVALRVPSADYPAGMLVYTNPARADVQKRNLAVIEEILKQYPVEGVVLDRGRFDNFKADFSDESLAEFAKSLERKSVKPEEIYDPADPLTGTPRREGPLFAQWLTWRARVIQNFMEQANATVRKYPNRCFGDYVGGWYESYWEVGANWAIPDFDPQRNFPTLPADYRRTAYAHLLDYLSPGLYYRKVLGPAGEKPTVESGLELVRRVTGGRVQLAPGIYPPIHATPEDVEAAVRLCIQRTGGVMVFSHTTLENKKLWDVVRRALDAVPQLLE
ncbi:MAG: hypothetical protein D6691_01560 [Candidatus Hydrogenedentota bacterium]|uniref:S-layer related protein, sialic acid-specific 9-O-acetylesterase n=1 Tax=Sumerlaea chitinivorans TaxID=2250252 RepID=A0A2Z4Y7L2_SUMC1|nr:S-layer related protein precursor, sialic acid-specific 9-O-acetylesterase [Candidatus Sumerlaea chitinivorans]RMH30253.1 MAG: hypothetical protein D6691_01560 [Candidatus Hydrogenedentota bacterium]GIX43873.1 MAG: hypothetical protein KatS3mg130_0281 [Candidatus Sumerlaea sp.]